MNQSRREFLQTVGAAGALAASMTSALPFFASVARAQSARRIGSIVINDRGALRVHTYVSPDASVSVTSHIFETPSALVMIDAQFTQTFASELRAYADSLNKPIDRLIISHAHPDHFLGTSLFTDVPLIATPGIVAGIEGFIEAGGLQGIAGLIGESEVPASVPVPDVLGEADSFTVDGVTFSLSTVRDAESPEQVNVAVPDAGIIALQDLLFTNIHYFPGENRQNWISILDSLRETTTADTVLLAGHGLPTSVGELDDAIRYLTIADEAASQAATAEDVVAALQAEFPGYQGTFILSFWANAVPAS